MVQLFQARKWSPFWTSVVHAMKSNNNIRKLFKFLYYFCEYSCGSPTCKVRFPWQQEFSWKTTLQAHLADVSPAKIGIVLHSQNHKFSYLTAQKFQCVFCKARYSNFICRVHCSWLHSTEHANRSLEVLHVTKNCSHMAHTQLLAARCRYVDTVWIY